MLFFNVETCLNIPNLNAIHWLMKKTESD